MTPRQPRLLIQMDEIGFNSEAARKQVKGRYSVKATAMVAYRERYGQGYRVQTKTVGHINVLPSNMMVEQQLKALWSEMYGQTVVGRMNILEIRELPDVESEPEAE